MSLIQLHTSQFNAQKSMSQENRTHLILPVYLPTLILSFGRGMIIPILPLYAKSFATSYGLIGLILAAEGIGHLTGDLPTGVLLRKIGRKPVMIFGVTCVALSVLALVWAQTVFEVVLYRLAAGIGGAFWNISRHTYLASVTSPYQRGRAISIFGGINRIGTFAGPAAGGVFGALYGLRSAFLIYAGLAVLTIVTSALTIEKTRVSGSTPEGQLSHLLGVFKSHYRQLATAGLGQLFAQTLRRGRHVIVPLYAADIIGLDVQAVGWILSVSAFLDMSMFYPAGLMMDRYGRKYATVPSFLTQTVGMGLIPFADGFFGLLLATSVIGLGNGLGSGSMMTLGADLAPRASIGEFLAVWRLIGDGGDMGSPLLVGGIADLLGLSAATFAISGIGLLAAGTFALLVPETLRKTGSGG